MATALLSTTVSTRVAVVASNRRGLSTTRLSGARASVANRASISMRRVPATRASASTFAVVAAAPDDAATDEGADAMSIFSPSKVNLFLRIVRRRPDGYHDLASLFHVIDLGDDMKFAKSSSVTRDTLVCSDDTIPLDGSNLVIKALDLFRAKTGSKQYFWVELEKKVPHGAGLGGGSRQRRDCDVGSQRTVWPTSDGGTAAGVVWGHRQRHLRVLLHRCGVLHRSR